MSLLAPVGWFAWSRQRPPAALRLITLDPLTRRPPPSASALTTSHSLPLALCVRHRAAVGSLRVTGVPDDVWRGLLEVMRGAERGLAGLDRPWLVQMAFR